MKINLDAKKIVTALQRNISKMDMAILCLAVLVIAVGMSPQV
jgi:hypothetical protein